MMMKQRRAALLCDLNSPAKWAASFFHGDGIFAKPGAIVAISAV